MFSQIAFQEELIERLKEITATAVGQHVKRSRGAAIRSAMRELQNRGYTEQEARQITDQAWDMFRLNQLCDSE